MVNAKLHVICGNCGHSTEYNNFTYEYIPKEDYDNGEFEPADVFIRCTNCATLHSLSDYMKEYVESEE